ncbi:hypothetical protein JCM10212_004854 [Sporobolomyces blumeae]
MKSDDLQERVLEFIAAIPKTTNPYRALAGWIEDEITPDVPYSGLVQLYILATLLGAALFLVVVSLLVRARKGIFWIFQVSHSPTLIRPHFSISWSLIACVMLALFEAYIVQCIHLFKREIRPSLGYWTLLIWVICWCGGEMAAWSLGVSFLTHVQAGGTDITRWARIVNIVAVTAPVVYLVAIVPVATITGRHFQNAIETYVEIDAILDDAASSWVSPAALNIAKLAPALPLVANLEEVQSSLTRGWSWTYGLYCVLTFLLVATLVTIGGLHIASLRKRLQSSKRDLRDTLKATVCAFVLMGIVFTSISAFASSRPQSLQDAVTAQILVLGPLWAFALLGLPTSASLVWRAWEARPSEGGRWDASGGSSGSQSRDREDAVKKFSIELGGRSKTRSTRPGRSTLTVEGLPPNAVNLTVDVLVKEEGGDLEKWETQSGSKV